jgi:UDP-N-acetylglucosamine--N-acetylmuramyl-(pentapeptide) pyrophosphoryl-undecaprenol N-acetylglucosamine transferase
MKLLLAGGGTAGHIEPALAVGRGWLKAHPGDDIVFLGTSSGLETSIIPAAGFSVLEIPKVAIARSLSPSLVKVPFQLIAAVAQTMKYLKGVDCTIGFGGYVSGPLYLAAFLKRVPLVIHEQNAKPGWANRLGSIFTKFTATSYPVHTGALKKAELTGLPLRSDVLAAIESANGDWSAARRSAKHSISEKYGFDEKTPLIFIFGGSQGSQAINKVIAQARPGLESSGYSILHGVGKNNDVPASSHHYRALPYISEMAECYLAADLLIARSGAVTCAEATALSKYSLFIPLPVGNGEQALNAQSLVEAGRAQVINQSDFTAEWISANLAEVLGQSSRRSDVGDASGVNAVDKILLIIERALRGR